MNRFTAVGFLALIGLAGTADSLLALPILSPGHATDAARPHRPLLFARFDATLFDSWEFASLVEDDLSGVPGGLQGQQGSSLGGTTASGADRLMPEDLSTSWTDGSAFGSRLSNTTSLSGASGTGSGSDIRTSATDQNMGGSGAGSFVIGAHPAATMTPRGEAPAAPPTGSGLTPLSGLVASTPAVPEQSFVSSQLGLTNPNRVGYSLPTSKTGYADASQLDVFSPFDGLAPDESAFGPLALDVQALPEPSSLILLLTGLGTVAVRRARRRP